MAKKKRAKVVAFRVHEEDAGIVKDSVWKILKKKKYKRYAKKENTDSKASKA